MASENQPALIILLRWFLLFLRNTVGAINAPYQTYRRMIFKNETLGQILYIGIFCIGYFTFAATIRTGIRNPILLTLQFNKLMIFSMLNFFLVTFVLYNAGKILRGKGTYKNILLTWSYTLLPTLLWFFVTSIVYILLPPPRTLSIPGKLFSVLYIGFSLTILYWKIVLYYLTLRFALKLDLAKIAIVSIFFAAYIAVYGVLMYKAGIFRIPFI